MLRTQHSVRFVGFGGNFVIYLKNEKEGVRWFGHAGEVEHSAG